MNIIANKFLSSLNSWDRNDFQYGITDCCQFASHVVKEITGEDHAAKFQYGSEEEAQRIRHSCKCADCRCDPCKCDDIHEASIVKHQWKTYVDQGLVVDE